MTYDEYANWEDSVSEIITTNMFFNNDPPPEEGCFTLVGLLSYLSSLC